MILRKFSCTVLEYRDPYYWRLHPVDLEKINLFVAKNATGKTKTVNAIFSLGKLISGTDVFIQLIMSTNDHYVMNNVPLEYWQVIQRKGGECRVFNYQNSKEKFDEFEYMGLNNFDFLATDYLNSKWEKI